MQFEKETQELEFIKRLSDGRKKMDSSEEDLVLTTKFL